MLVRKIFGQANSFRPEIENFPKNEYKFAHLKKRRQYQMVMKYLYSFIVRKILRYFSNGLRGLYLSYRHLTPEFELFSAEKVCNHGHQWNNPNANFKLLINS